MEENSCVDIESTKDQAQSYSCGKCSKAFTTFSEFHQHMKSHINDPKFQLDPKESYKCKVCDKSSFNALELKKHEKSHSQKSHECEICGKSVKNLAALLQHKKYKYNNRFKTN